jgi:ATP dependent DNA ligase domain
MVQPTDPTERLDPAAAATATPAAPSQAKAALADLRPQAFGTGSPGSVRNPLVEPLWVGIRSLAAVDDGGALVVDERGEPVEGHERIVYALAAATRTDGLILDGFLTKQALHDTSGIYTGTAELPSVGALVGQTMVGVRRNRSREAAERLEASIDERTFLPTDEVSFVAVDLLWLDGEWLLDVPLLERRRLLEAVLDESDVVRRGTFVRPPIETWIGSWRAQGFGGLTFKGANSRYQPGVANPDWAISSMPRR